MKIIKLSFFITIFFASTLFANAQEANWLQIKVMQSTRADVERILGKPSKPPNNSFTAFYRLDNGNLFVIYSLRLCESDDRGGWNVDEGVVTKLGFFPDISPKIKSLKLDKKKYKKSLEGGDTLGIYSYKDDEAGIEYTVQNGIVETVTYYPGRKYEHLRCSVVNQIK